MSERSKYMKAHKGPPPVGGALPMFADDLAPSGKRTKESVNYSKGREAEHCGICKHFQLPNACELVDGHIVPSYWCRLFVKSKITKFGALRSR